MHEDCFHLGAKALIQNRKGELLLLKRTAWDLPGGRIQRNESLEQALKREIYEETGLKHITQIRPLTMALSAIRIPMQNSDVGLIFAIYACQLEGDDTVRLSDEHKDFAWFEPKKAAELLPPTYPSEIRIQLRTL